MRESMEYTKYCITTYKVHIKIGANMKERISEQGKYRKIVDSFLHVINNMCKWVEQ